MSDAWTRFVFTPSNRSHDGAHLGGRRFSRYALQLIDVRQDGAEIRRQTFEFRLGEFQFGEFCNMSDLFERQSHERLRTRKPLRWELRST